MTKVYANGTEKPMSAEAFNSWFKKMENIMRNDPQRLAFNEEFEKRRIENQKYQNYMNCGAPYQALLESGWDKFKIIGSASRQMAGLYNVFQSYVNALLGQDFDYGMVISKDSNFLLQGLSGTCKTFFALSVIKQLAYTKKPPRKYLAYENGLYVEKDLYVDEYYNCSYVKSNTLIMELTSKDYNGGERKRACWNQYSSADFLVIDNCFGDGGYKEREELKILCQIFDARMERRLPTMLITGALPEDGAEFDWNKHLGAGLLNKLSKCSLILDTNGFPDMRDPKIQNFLKNKVA